MPDIESAEYLVSAFHGVGMVVSNGMGITAISWLELSAYCSITVTDLSGWESEIIMDMSRAYSSTFRKAEDPTMTAPFTMIDDDDALKYQREIVVKQFKEMKEQRKNLKLIK